jgi:hypothetical protein
LSFSLLQSTPADAEKPLHITIKRIAIPKRINKSPQKPAFADLCKIHAADRPCPAKF